MNKIIKPQEQIFAKIIVLRDEKIILDFHLSELYSVPTRVLKQAVKRNIDLFPEDFMFELNEVEIDLMVSQNVIPSKSYFGGAFPYAFTETGVAMLSSVLKSPKAREMNIAIMRAFVALRKLAINYNEIQKVLNDVQSKINTNEKNITYLFQYLEKLEKSKRQKQNFIERTKIGFK